MLTTSEEHQNRYLQGDNYTPNKTFLKSTVVSTTQYCTEQLENT